jgi:O-antigen/teichoic acid export membrane protein
MDEINNSERANRRIAKNTFLLYCRMLISTIIGLYTSRVVLEVLGVVDFGIYGIVGSVTTIFMYLNTSMSGATSRFLTFELGNNNQKNLKETFSAVLTIHILMAILILILGETIGLWFFENKIVVPAGRMGVSRFVYQISIVTAMITVTQVPYNSSIIAHENMEVSACVEIIKSVLTLLSAFLLRLGNSDRLLIYAALILCVSLTTTLAYRIYCIHNYSECKTKLSWEWRITKPILLFWSYELYGSLCGAARGPGVNILLNIFFSTVLNAAYGIAMQVQNAVTALAFNFLNAVRPQIVKLYASDQIEKMLNLIYNSSKYSFLLVVIIILPLILENNFILHIWLKTVPDYSIIFCSLVLIERLVYSIFSITTFAVQATGKVRETSIISGTIYLLVIPLSYFLLKSGFSPIFPFILNILLLLLGFSVFIYSLNKYIPQFSISKYFFEVVFVDVYMLVISAVFPLLFHFFLGEGWIRLMAVSFSSFISVALTVYFFVLNKEMRKRMALLFLKKIHNILLYKRKLPY